MLVQSALSLELHFHTISKRLIFAVPPQPPSAALVASRSSGSKKDWRWHFASPYRTPSLSQAYVNSTRIAGESPSVLTAHWTTCSGLDHP